MKYWSLQMVRHFRVTTLYLLEATEDMDLIEAEDHEKEIK